MAHVRRGEQWRPIKNLGWLLVHWQEVERFELVPHTHVKYWVGDELRDLPPKKHNADWLLIAHLKGDVQYVAEWADYTTLRDWLVRPVFKGVPVTWLGIRTKIPDNRQDW